MLFGLLFGKNIKNLSDAELIDLIRKSDRDAEGEIFVRYSHLVMGLCLKYLKDLMSAEDMMMKVFEQLPGKIKKNEISNFKSWLYSVSRNECLMDLRKNKPDSSDIEKSLLTETDNSEEELNLSYVLETKINKLEEAIEQLKDEQKLCIQLFYLKKKCYDEIADKTGFDLKKVKSYIQNGKRNLKLLLENESEFK